MKEFRKFLLKNRIAPKWLIFSLDLTICIVAFIYANYLLSDFRLVSVDLDKLIQAVIVVGLTSSVFFFIFKTYDGIIRLSEFHEAIRAIAAVFCSFFIILLLNVVLALCKTPTFIANSALFVYFFTASFIISGYRILVKNLYMASVNQADSVNVIIYGAELNGSLLQKTIEKISNSQYRVVAFIDDDEKFIGKTIDNIRIYSYRNLAELLKSFNVKLLFFARQDIDIAIKNNVVDQCLEAHIKVMNIPPVKSWMYGHLNISQLQEVKIEELLERPTIQLSNPEVVNFLCEKRILITGAAGSIGAELARQIAFMNPVSLIICDQLETGLYNLEYELQQKFKLGSSLKVYLADVKDHYSMDQMFSIYKPDVVFHAAAYKHVPMMEKHPSEAIRNNVLGTKVIADLSEIYGVERFLLISTDKAINPTNIMGASKRIAEIYCHSLQQKEYFPLKNGAVYHMPASRNKTKFITTRFGNVLASNGSVIPRFQEQIRSGGPVTVTHPEIIRYFMTIPEACSLVLEAVTMGNGGEVFLFDMGEPIKILNLAKKMILLAGLEPGKDIKVTFTGLRPGEKLYEELLNKEEEVIPTHHKKILIAKIMEYNLEKISGEIAELLRHANKYKDAEVVKQMKHIVPEYISNNSAYELYDSDVYAIGKTASMG